MEASTVGAWLVSESATQLQGFDGMFGAAFRLWSTWINKQSSCLHWDTVGILGDIWVTPWFAMDSDLSDMSWTKIWKTDKNAKKTPYRSTCKTWVDDPWWSLDWLRYPNQHTTANVDYGLGMHFVGQYDIWFDDNEIYLRCTAPFRICSAIPSLTASAARRIAYEIWRMQQVGASWTTVWLRCRMA